MGSLYSEYTTWLHHGSAGAKLLALSLAGMLLFATSQPGALAAASLLCAALYASLGQATLGSRRLLGSVTAAAALVAAFHAWMGTWQTGLASALRLASVCMLGIAFTVTTRSSDIVEVLQRLLEPLRPLGVQPEQLSLQLALMLRFTEHFFIQWKKLDEAHRVRTGRAGGLRLVAPLTVQMLKTMRSAGDALYVRLGRD
ncbi:CbiQ family ECF transporter T component [Comamonas flocculans]|uniref:Energy-coupling factor transporter transmembrane protein EcfT n=1 Tax=Comamonas flocculans TaxID=2597701 RepID=A0A5B8RZZ5_9BURK|nr:CbiQ family ECF transporter T component [Comamonas flocculans]QEA13557.1 energy-coupling factor transporter transmembrane protein EcfT [Comamonas flocculans]